MKTEDSDDCDAPSPGLWCQVDRHATRGWYLPVDCRAILFVVQAQSALGLLNCEILKVLEESL